jgi:hypothetical protein
MNRNFSWHGRCGMNMKIFLIKSHGLQEILQAPDQENAMVFE